MTFETVIAELFGKFPSLKVRNDAQLDYMGDEPPLAYVVFGSVLIPSLDDALRAGDTQKIVSICSFFEECAESARHDGKLADLVRVEVDEWLATTTNEEELAPFLGSETKKLCRYVPGLATQRWKLKMAQHRSSLWQSVTSIWKKS
jgi:hypothetical protein